ncbi:MAG: galactosyldiacylglycerol synthase [Chthoniobacterales bacterium]|nr:galactosyldiacylglycerol synthase [Chthoniobacterales bacterium]
MPKRILILTAGFGEGHNAAARGLRDGLALVAPETAEVELHDIFAETYGRTNDVVRRGYLALINRAPAAWAQVYDWIDRQKDARARLRVFFQARNRLRDLLARFRPDVVVSVFPGYPHLLDEIAAGTRPPFRRVVCVTDSITINAIWYRCTCDYFLVPNDATASVLTAVGVPNDRIRATGFPVTPKFSQLGPLRQPPSAEYGRRILYMINAGHLIAPETIRRLSQMSDMRLTVTVGRAQKLQRAVEAVRNNTGRMFEIIGWSDQLPRLMLESHLLISKAGGATVQETIAACCPMIVNQIVPGQEAGNAQLIRASGSGTIATTAETIAAAVEKAFADDARVWREWSTNITRLSRPRAALEIAEWLMQL